MPLRNGVAQSDTSARDNTKGFLYALGGTLLVSTNYITAKYALKGFNPETFSLIWTSAAGVYAFIFLAMSGRVKEILIPRSAALGIMTLGLATGAGMILGWSGLSLIDPAFASFLWRFSPVLIILLSVCVLGERLRTVEILAIAVMVLGGALTTLGRWHIVGTGVVLTLSGCVAVAVQMLVVKMNVGKIHPNILVFYRVFLAAIVIGIWTVARGKFAVQISASHLAVTLLGAFLGPCASFLLTFRSYRYWPLSRSTILLTAQPLIVLPMAYLAFGAIPAGLELVGGAIILCGAFFLVWLHHSQTLQ
ncbi:MAG: DMT family transporter [candidate division WOR-3 bacterium]|nr:MAG: DMT family transporter [candidate division WOR-3 bacterium]